MRWLVIVLIACGDNFVDEPADSHSGSRLKLYWFEGSDESRSPARESRFGAVRFHDAARDEDCEPFEWADGSTRCTPGVDHSTFGRPAFATTVFLDQGCTQPVGDGAATTTYFLHGEWRGEQFYPSSLLRTTRRAVTQTSVYYRRDGECLGPLVPTALLFELDHSGGVQPGELVETEQRSLDATARLTELVEESADGMQLGLDLYDRTLDTRCFPELARGGLVCAPSPAAEVEDRYLDDQCTRPALATDDPRMRFAWTYSPLDGCSDYFRLGAPATGASFQRVDGACVPAPVPEGSQVFAIGEPVALAPVERTVAPSEHRLASLLASTRAAPAIGIYDTELATACDYFEDTLFGFALHCRPTWVAPIEPAFADAACLQPIDVSRWPTGECWTRPRYAQDGFGPYREIGGEIDAFTRTDAGACVALRAPPGYSYQRLGRTVTDDQLVRAELVHE